MNAVRGYPEDRVAFERQSRANRQHILDPLTLGHTQDIAAPLLIPLYVKRYVLEWVSDVAFMSETDASGPSTLVMDGGALRVCLPPPAVRLAPDVHVE